MQTPAGPKGTRDFYPEDMVLRNYIFRSWEKSCRRYGFEPYDGPMFEHLEIYTQKSGEEIEKQLYAFDDKGGRRIALRPELTPTLARMVAARGSNIKRPIRWFSIPPLFRYERMQRGRLRQFFQLNMDILGVQDVTADAELIASVVGMMTDLGFDAADFAVHVSSRTLLEELLTSSGVQSEKLTAIYAVLDRRHKSSPEQFIQDLAAQLPGTGTVDSVLSILDAKSFDDIAGRFADRDSVVELSRLFELTHAYGISDYVTFDIGIVRGLAYYTGIVFEVFDRRRSLRAIAGGGRYDKLVSLYGGPDTPAVGFAAGDVVLGELLKDKGIAIEPDCRSEVFVVNLDRESSTTSIAITQEIRFAGISAEMPLTAVNVGKQMKQANACRARLVVFSGGEEAENGQVRLKDMRTGDESTVQRDQLVEALKRAL